MRKIGYGIVAALLLGLAGAGGYYVYTVLIENQFGRALDRAIAQLPPNYSARYKTLRYAPAARNAVLTGFVLHKSDPEGFDLAIEEIDLSGPALNIAAAWSEARGNPGAVTPEMVLPLADRVAMKGITYHVGAMSGSIGSMTGDGFRLYPWSLVQPGIPTWPEAMAALQRPRLPATDLVSLQPLFQFSAAWMLAIGYDHYVVENVNTKAKLPMPPGNALTEVGHTVAKVDAYAAERGIFGAGTLEGYKTESRPGMRADVEHVAMSGFDIRNLLTQFVTKKTFAPEMLDGTRVERIDYGGMSFEIPGSPAFTLDSLHLGKILFSGAMPVSGEFVIGGIKFRRAQFTAPQTADAFAKLDLDSVTINLGLSYQWDLAARHIAMPDLILDVSELGSLHVALDVTDLAPGLAGAMQARLGHAKLRYSDHSLAERALRAGADLSHLDPAAYRQQLIDAIGARASAFPDNAALQDVTKELIAFLNTPQSLSIELTPPKPVPMMALLSAAKLPPGQLADLLGASFAANR